MLFGVLSVPTLFKTQMRPQMGPEDAQKLNKWARSIGPTETFLTNGLGP